MVSGSSLMKKNKAEYERERKQGNFKHSDIWMAQFFTSSSAMNSRIYF